MAARRKVGRPSKRLARSIALVGEQAYATGARAAMTHDAGAGGRGGLLGQPFLPQLLHAAADYLEIVSGSGLWHQSSERRPNMPRYRSPTRSTNAVWTYEAPYEAVSLITDHLPRPCRRAARRPAGSSIRAERNGTACRGIDPGRRFVTSAQPPARQRECPGSRDAVRSACGAHRPGGRRRDRLSTA